MRVNCTICTDLFLSESDISVTDCGHAFHTACLFQWLERSKTCPQCRRRTFEKKLIKLFLNHVPCTHTDEEPDQIQHELESLRFKVSLHSGCLNKITTEKQKLEEQTKQLREELCRVEKKLKVKEDALVAHQLQLRCLSDVSRQRDKSTAECQRLRDQLAHLSKVEKLVKQSCDEVEQMLSSYPTDDQQAAKNMATYCVILKKELSRSNVERRSVSDDRHRLRSLLHTSRMQLQQLQQRHDQLATQLHDAQAQLSSCELENQQLSKQVKSLEATLATSCGGVGHNNNNCTITGVLAERSATPAGGVKTRQTCDLVNNNHNTSKQLTTSVTSSGSDSDVIALDEDESPRVALAAATFCSANRRRLNNVQQSVHMTSSPDLAASRCNPFASKRVCLARNSVGARRAVDRSRLKNVNLLRQRLSPVSGESCSGSSPGDPHAPLPPARDGKQQHDDALTVGWDGLGGSSRPDLFPRLRPARLNVRMKGVGAGDGKARCRSGSSVITIDNFFTR